MQRSVLDFTLIRLPFIQDKPAKEQIKDSIKEMPGLKITVINVTTYALRQIQDTRYFLKAPFFQIKCCRGLIVVQGVEKNSSPTYIFRWNKMVF